jgi:hypothetical protein
MAFSTNDLLSQTKLIKQKFENDIFWCPLDLPLLYRHSDNVEITRRNRHEAEHRYYTFNIQRHIRLYGFIRNVLVNYDMFIHKILDQLFRHIPNIVNDVKNSIQSFLNISVNNFPFEQVYSYLSNNPLICSHYPEPYLYHMKGRIIPLCILNQQMTPCIDTVNISSFLQDMYNKIVKCRIDNIPFYILINDLLQIIKVYHLDDMEELYITVLYHLL